MEEQATDTPTLQPHCSQLPAGSHLVISIRRHLAYIAVTVTAKVICLLGYSETFYQLQRLYNVERDVKIIMNSE
jgi:hypothetical protein